MKTFYRCVWGMMVSLLCGVGQANADSSSLDSIQTLGEVMVTANRYNEVIPSQKLTGKELKALNSFSVADAIRYFSGLQIKDYGGVGGLKTVNIRSMGTNHMGVYYNGIQLGNAQNGQVDLGKFSLENIEEISLYNGQKSEIFQSAREFGSAGSIYLTTRRPKFKPGEKSHLKASVKAGSFDLLNPSVLFEYKLSETVSMTFNSEWINSSGKYKFRYRRVTPSGETAYDTTATRKNGDIDAVRFEGGLQGYLPNGYWKTYVYHYSSERGIPGAIVNNVWRNGERLWDRNSFVQGVYQQDITRKYGIKVNAKYAFDYTHYMNNDDKLMRVDNQYKQREVYVSVANKYSIFRNWDVSVAYDMQWNGLSEYMSADRYTHWISAATAFSLADRLKMQASVLATLVDEKASGQFTATPNNFKKWECVDKEDHWNSPSVSEDGAWHCLARSESGNEAETEINKMPIQNRYTYIFYYDKPGSDTPDYANAVAVEPYIQEAVDYSQGIFFVNEDWYGWDNGTINFLTNDGRMVYRIFRRENPDEKLGVTTQFGTIYGEKFFLISKQAKSTEEESTGGRLVVADALSLEKIAAFDQIGGGDGRSFLGVDEKTGYIGSSSGIFVFDIENMKVGDVIEGTSNDEGLYSGQIGSMVRAGKYVFAAKQSEGVLVIDAENHTLQTTIELPSIATLVLGRDGNIWAADGNALVRINPVSFETWTRSLPSGCRVTDTWGAWNAGSLCAAYKSNLLYFADESKNKVVRYNIDTDELNASFFTLPDQDGEYVQMFYGAGLRVDPQTDNVVVTSTESGYLSHYMNNWIHIVDGTNGELLNTLLPEKYYWFPAMPVFPDNEYPVISISDNLSVGSSPVKISLLESVSDADNLSAAVVSTVKVEDPSILSARIEGYDLILSGEKLGDTSFSLTVNSNGRVETKMVSVHVTEVSGIEDAESLKIVASPNPVRDILTVRACVGAELTVFDLRGVAVYRDTMVGSKSRLNVSSLPAGIYVLSVCANDRTEYIRIIKQ